MRKQCIALLLDGFMLNQVCIGSITGIFRIFHILFNREFLISQLQKFRNLAFNVKKTKNSVFEPRYEKFENF